MTPDEATAEVRRTRGTSVWVFCHTLELYELAPLAVAIRTHHPQDKLLRLIGLEDVHTNQTPGLFDDFLEPVLGVDDLLSLVRDLAYRAS